jgi:hypothetical protein
MDCVETRMGGRRGAGFVDRSFIQYPRMLCSRPAVALHAAGLDLSRSLVRLCEAARSGRLCMRHGMYTSEGRHKTFKPSVVESTLTAGAHPGFSLSGRKTSRRVESHVGYVGSFATRCRTMGAHCEGAIQTVMRLAKPQFQPRRGSTSNFAKWQQ